MESVCRVCLREDFPAAELRHIFGSRRRLAGSAVSCAEMLAVCGPYEANVNDGFPANICLECYKRLRAAYKFRKLCESSYLALLERSTNAVKVESDDKKSDDIAEMDESPEAQSEEDRDDLDDHDNHNDHPELFNEENYSSDSKINSEQIADKKERKRLKRANKESKQKKVSPKEQHPKVHACSLCPKLFKWKHMLLAHQDSHFDIKRYFCEICQKAYRNEKDHKNFHRRGFKFQCDTCAKCFSTKAKLTIHQETHSVERVKFFCEEPNCGKVFLSLNGLDRHKISHIGLKNFICQMCSKSFIDKYQLEVHVRTHTGDRRYPCNFCEKRFITTSARNSHERWHTKTKNYLCTQCEKAFVSSSGLKRHILCHTKELPEECRFCGKRFARFDNKKRHEMSTHQFAEKCTMPTIVDA